MIRLQEQIINVSASGDNQIIASNCYIYKIFFVCAAATNITVKDGSTALTGAMTMTDAGAFALDMDNSPWFSCATSLQINSSVATQISGRVYYSTNYGGE